MRNVLLIMRRELKAYVRSPLGYVVAAAVLLLDGILFFAMALGDDRARLSADVLSQFFYLAGGVTMIACIALSMRLVAQEHEQGTLVLLRTSPIRDRELVLGKYLSVMVVMTVLTAMTAYMPALIFVNGKVALGHILVGYAGVLLLASGAVAIGLFASALAKNQVIAAIIGTAILGTLVLLWMLARVADPPVNELIESLAFHHHRQQSFLRGVLRLEHVVYYVAVSFFFIMAAIKTLEARRWQ